MPCCHDNKTRLNLWVLWVLEIPMGIYGKNEPTEVQRFPYVSKTNVQITNMGKCTDVFFYASLKYDNTRHRQNFPVFYRYIRFLHYTVKYGFEFFLVITGSSCLSLCFHFYLIGSSYRCHASRKRGSRGFVQSNILKSYS